MSQTQIGLVGRMKLIVSGWVVDQILEKKVGLNRNLIHLLIV